MLTNKSLAMTPMESAGITYRTTKLDGAIRGESTLRHTATDATYVSDLRHSLAAHQE